MGGGLRSCKWRLWRACMGKGLIDYASGGKGEGIGVWLGEGRKDMHGFKQVGDVGGERRSMARHRCKDGGQRRDW